MLGGHIIILCGYVITLGGHVIILCGYVITLGGHVIILCGYVITLGGHVTVKYFLFVGIQFSLFSWLALPTNLRSHE